MGATPDLHGLGWPEGNPDGLSASARRLAGLGGAMEAFGGRTEAIPHPGGWAGQGADSFSAATGRQAAMLRARGADLRGAGGALNSLSVMLESDARAEGDSTGRAAREAGVVGVTTVVGSGVGGVACGAVGSVSLGAGYASCVVLVSAGGVIGKVAGDGINLLVDTVGL